MIARAQAKFIRGSAKKIRKVADVIRGMNANEALANLKFINKGAAYYIRKVLNSAVANARTKGLNVDELVISKITADEGPRWKRYRPAAFGRATEILKRTSHIKIELDLKEGKPKKAVPVLKEEKKKSSGLLRGRRKKPVASKKIRKVS